MWCWEGLGQGWGRVTGFLDSGFCSCTGTAMQPGATFGVGLRKKIGLQCPYADRSPRSRAAEGSARSGRPGGLTSPPPNPRWAGLGPQAGVMGCRQPARHRGAQRWRSAQSRSGDSRRHHVSREGAGRTGGVCHPAWGRQEEVAFPQDSEGALVPGPVLARLWLCALHGEETTGTELRVRASAVSAHQVAVHLAGVDAQDHAGVIP